MADERTEYQEDLSIDKHRLDVEWEDQPSIYMKWAERYSEAVYERDRLKEKLDLIKAQLDTEIRRRYSTGKKPTEAAITNEIIDTDDFQDATEDYLQAKKDVNILGGVKEAMEHKKKALEAETSLWIGEYYSEPKISEKAREMSSKDVSENVRKTLRRRTT